MLLTPLTAALLYHPLQNCLAVRMTSTKLVPSFLLTLLTMALILLNLLLTSLGVTPALGRLLYK